MLMIQNLTIKTINEQRILIDNLNFTCQNTDKIAVIGEEGNGKSTLLKGIVDQKLIYDFAVLEGKIALGNSVVGYLPQVLDSNWNETSTLDFLLLDNYDEQIDVESYGKINDIYSIIGKFNLRDDILDDMLMGKLSGGEKVKLQLLKLMLKNPDLLLLDEPTNDLDIGTLEWLEEFIINSTVGVMFISHDEYLLDRCANAILHLEQTKRKTKPRWTFERIGYEDYIEKRSDLVTRQNRIAGEEKRSYRKQMDRYLKVYQAVEHAQRTITRQNPFKGKMLKKKMSAVKSWGKRLENKELTESVEIEERVSLYFHDNVYLNHNKCVLEFELDVLAIEDRLLSKDISLEVYGQDKIVIIGRNGSGKTTLLKKIYDVLKKRVDIKLGWMPQNYDEYLPNDISAVEYLAPDRLKETITKVQKHLGSINFTVDEMYAPISSYSQGQKAKLLLVKMVLEEVNVLLLDEPTRNLSPLTNPVVRDILGNFNGCIISVSHDRKYIEEAADVVYLLEDDGLKLLQD